MFTISEEEYLSHYGRKGMKWYQHIFGEYQEHAKYNKSKFKTDEDSDNALLSRLKVSKNGDYRNDNKKEQTEIFNEILSKVGDSYSGKWISEKAKKNRRELNDKLKEFKISKLSNDYNKALNEWRNYRDNYNGFGNPHNTKAGKILESKYRELLSKYTKEETKIRNKYNQEMLGIALEELGYRDTPKGREILDYYWLVFYD